MLNPHWCWMMLDRQSRACTIPPPRWAANASPGVWTTRWPVEARPGPSGVGGWFWPTLPWEKFDYIWLHNTTWYKNSMVACKVFGTSHFHDLPASSASKLAHIERLFTINSYRSNYSTESLRKSRSHPLASTQRCSASKRISLSAWQVIIIPRSTKPPCDVTATSLRTSVSPLISGGVVLPSSPGGAWEFGSVVRKT